MLLTSNRRVFMIQSASAGAALVVGAQAHAQAQPMVSEKDPQAVALGYVTDAKRVDTKKFPKYVAGEGCHNCQLFQGKATDKVGGCLLFGGKHVDSTGWCNGWTKKA